MTNTIIYIYILLFIKQVNKKSAILHLQSIGVEEPFSSENSLKKKKKKVSKNTGSSEDTARPYYILRQR